MNPDDERAAFWQAVHTVDDRVTALEATVTTRNEMMRESILSAVREAMPKNLVSDGEHEFLRMLMEREKRKAQFQQKIIEGTAIWAVPSLIGGALWVIWKLFVGWASAKGLWKE